MRDKSSTELFEIVRRAFVFTAPHVVDAALALTEIEERWFSGRTQATPAPAPEQAPAPAPPQHFGPHTPQSVLARLTRLEENSHKPVDFSPMLARLTRVEEDLAAFKREHAGHRHTTLGDVQVGTTRPTLFGEDRDTQGMHNAADAARETSTESLLNTRSRLYKKDPASPGVLKYVGTTEAREPTCGDYLRSRDGSENRAWQCFEAWNKQQPNARHAVLVRPPLHSTDRWTAAIIRIGFSSTIASEGGTSRVDALTRLAEWCQGEMPA